MADGLDRNRRNAEAANEITARVQAVQHGPERNTPPAPTRASSPSGGIQIVIVPNDLRDAINGKLDAALAECPDAEKDRVVFYRQLLCYFDEYGVVPDFSLEKK